MLVRRCWLFNLKSQIRSQESSSLRLLPTKTRLYICGPSCKYKYTLLWSKLYSQSYYVQYHRLELCLPRHLYSKDWSLIKVYLVLIAVNGQRPTRKSENKFPWCQASSSVFPTSNLTNFFLCGGTLAATTRSLYQWPFTCFTPRYEVMRNWIFSSSSPPVVHHGVCFLQVTRRSPVTRPLLKSATIGFTSPFSFLNLPVTELRPSSHPATHPFIFEFQASQPQLRVKTFAFRQK